MNLTQMIIISTTEGKNPLEEMETPSWSTEESEMQYLDAISKMTLISVRLQDKPFNITVIQVCVLTSDAEEIEQFYEELQDFLELTPPKDVFFITGGWNTKVGSQ